MKKIAVDAMGAIIPQALVEGRESKPFVILMILRLSCMGR